MAQIENISDTARWVAVYRAMETERSDAVFRDPFAARLAGEKGRAIVNTMKGAKAAAWAMIVRTAVFDEMILERVRNGNVDTVLNLAAGLDARAWRLPLPPTLRWIDVDLPGILDYKLETLRDEKPVCRYEGVRLDLIDGPKRRALFSQVDRESSRVLVVTEGLMIYLTPEQVGELAGDLHAARSFEWWLLDLANPRLLAIMTKYWGKNVRAGDAQFRFAPEEGTRFFEQFGWTEREFRSGGDEARRLNRQMRFMWVFRVMMRFRSKATRDQMRKFSGFALLERI